MFFIQRLQMYFILVMFYTFLKFFNLLYFNLNAATINQCSRIRVLRFFFQISKKHDFLRFFEMTFKKT